MEIKFKYPTHQCTATISGDWIVYLCPHCDGWQLKQNWKTGQIVRNSVAILSIIPHSGFVNTNDNMNPLKNISNEQYN